MMPCSIYYRIVQKKNMRRRARERERDWEERGELGLTEVIGIVR
jgi:hypothetical protein